MTKTIDAFVGQQIQTLRLAQGVSHELAAFRLRRWGINWTRSQLALVESGRRSITLGEWLALPAALTTALGCPPLTYADLLAETPTRVVLTRSLTALNDAVVRKLLQKNGDLSQVSFGAGDPMDLFERAAPKTERPYQDDVSFKASKRLRVPMAAIHKAAEALWRRPLSVERDLRIQNSGQSGRTVQALRGHITRALLRELAPQLIKMGYCKPKKGGQRPTRGRKEP